jgi:hypothetical protein
VVDDTLFAYLLLLLALLSTGRIFGRNVVLHLFLVTHLVLLRFLFPLAHLLLGKLLVLASQQTSLEIKIESMKKQKRG